MKIDESGKRIQRRQWEKETFKGSIIGFDRELEQLFGCMRVWEFRNVKRN